MGRKELIEDWVASWTGEPKKPKVKLSDLEERSSWPDPKSSPPEKEIPVNKSNV